MKGSAVRIRSSACSTRSHGRVANRASLRLRSRSYPAKVDAVRIGLHALGIGSGARREVIDAVAAAADAGGFPTLSAGEHIVMVDEPASRYPSYEDGRIAVPAHADWLDPLIA